MFSVEYCWRQRYHLISNKLIFFQRNLARFCIFSNGMKAQWKQILSGIIYGGALNHWKTFAMICLFLTFKNDSGKGINYFIIRKSFTFILLTEIFLLIFSRKTGFPSPVGVIVFSNIDEASFLSFFYVVLNVSIFINLLFILQVIYDIHIICCYWKLGKLRSLTLVGSRSRTTSISTFYPYTSSCHHIYCHSHDILDVVCSDILQEPIHLFNPWWKYYSD